MHNVKTVSFEEFNVWAREQARKQASVHAPNYSDTMKRLLEEVWYNGALHAYAQLNYPKNKE